MFNINRPRIAQQFTTQLLVVGTGATPLAPLMSIDTLIDSFAITVPATAANSIFLGGDAGVTITTGLELLAGTTTNWRIDHGGRQLYELQSPIMQILFSIICRLDQPEAIPFVVWDPSQIYLIASAATNITIALFKAMYI